MSIAIAILGFLAVWSFIGYWRLRGQMSKIERVLRILSGLPIGSFTPSQTIEDLIQELRYYEKKVE